MKITTQVFIVLFFFLCIQFVEAQPQGFNYDESKVPEYTLPSLFEIIDGKKAETVNEWKYQRRPEIIKLFEENVYGQLPGDYEAIRFDIVNKDKEAVNGTATLKEVDITIHRNNQDLTVRLNLFIPNNVPKPAPVFLLMNHRSPDNIDPTRRIKKEFWPAEEVISGGYAIGAFDVDDVANDDAETYSNDVIEKLYPEQLQRSDGMRALSAWAWGAMRIMDYFERDPDIDQDRSVLVGHSRGGKASLWAGAMDQRWSMTVSNNSGCGGAALSKRRFGETVQRINNSFPHWFTPNFEKYNENETELPVDQHMLIAAIAPNLVYVASAGDDKWADPKGEFLSLKHGSEVYQRIYNLPVDLPDSMPAIDKPVIKSYAGHHIREGKHGLTTYDWQRFMNFADYHFKTGR